jgi:hypothetical protein
MGVFPADAFVVGKATAAGMRSGGMAELLLFFVLLRVGGKIDAPDILFFYANCADLSFRSFIRMLNPYNTKQSAFRAVMDFDNIIYFHFSFETGQPHTPVGGVECVGNFQVASCGPRQLHSNREDHLGSALVPTYLGITRHRTRNTKRLTPRSSSANLSIRPTSVTGNVCVPARLLLLKRTFF